MACVVGSFRIGFNMDTTQKLERQGEYYFRIILAIVVMLLGVGIIIEPVFISHSQNGFQILVGLELLAGSYFIITKNFKGFKPPNE